MKNDNNVKNALNICPFERRHPEMLIGIPSDNSPSFGTDSKQSEYSMNTESHD